jgi:hypothetical protein
MTLDATTCTATDGGKCDATSVSPSACLRRMLASKISVTLYVRASTGTSASSGASPTNCLPS